MVSPFLQGGFVKKLMLSLGLLATVVSAKDMTGKLGVGGSQTLGGVNGLTVVTQLSNMLVVDGTLGLNIDDGELGWSLAGHGLLNFADFDNSNLLMGVGLNVTSDPDFEDHPFNISIDLPIRPVWYFNDHFAIFVETGFSISFLQKGKDTPAADHESVTIIDLKAQLLQSGGVHFFF